jgi:hypothetical protein
MGRVDEQYQGIPLVPLLWLLTTDTALGYQRHLHVVPVPGCTAVLCLRMGLRRDGRVESVDWVHSHSCVHAFADGVYGRPHSYVHCL